MGCGESKNVQAVQNPKVDIASLVANNSSKAPSPRKTPRDAEKQAEMNAVHPLVSLENRKEPVSSPVADVTS